VATDSSESRSTAGFAAIDHTDDVGLRVWAPSLEELFRQAACGLAALLADPAGSEPVTREEVRLEGIDLEELLVGWLGELLYRFESRRRISTEVASLAIERAATGYRLRAETLGAPWDPARQAPGSAIKAATYHRLRLAPDARGRYEVTIIFDS